MNALILHPIKFDQQCSDIIHQVEPNKSNPRSIQKGITYLALSPGSYVFWFTIAGPILYQVFEKNIFLIFYFLLGLYITYIGGNIVVAIAVHKAKGFINSNKYKYIITLFSIVLLGYSIFFLMSGLRLLGLIVL